LGGTAETGIRQSRPGAGHSSAVTGGALLFGFFLVLKFFVFFPESFNPTGGIDQFLFAGEEWMAIGADFNPDVFFSRARLHFVAAGTTNGCGSIFGMNAGFHLVFTPNWRLGVH
jgi:hypothetical protein